MKINNYHLAFMLLLLFAVGCGNPTVSGKITFPDGSPLDNGEVHFESAALVAVGTIQSNGSYTVFTGEQKGLPKGSYKVSIGGYKPQMISAPRAPGQMGPSPPPRMIAPVVPVAEKFLDSATSGLSVEVKGRTVYNFQVERP